MVYFIKLIRDLVLITTYAILLVSISTHFATQSKVGEQNNVQLGFL